VVVAGALLAAVAGVAVGTVEILDRYRDEPGRTLIRWPAIPFLAVNGVGAALAFALVHGLGWTLGLPDSVSDGGVIVIQALAAAFATLAIFRVQFLSVGRGPGATAVPGPSALLELLLTVCDRAIDRSRGPERQAVVTQVLVDLSFEDDHVALTQLAVSSLSRLKGEDADSLGRISRDLTAKVGMTDHQRMVCYGLDLLRLTGADTLRAAADHIRSTRPAASVAGPDVSPGPEVSPAPVWASANVSLGLAWSSIPSFPLAPPYPDRASLEAALERLMDGGDVIDLSKVVLQGKLAYMLAHSRRLAGDEAGVSYLAEARQSFTTVANAAKRHLARGEGVARRFLEAVEADAWLWVLACDIREWNGWSRPAWKYFEPVTGEESAARWDDRGDDFANIAWRVVCLLCLRKLYFPDGPGSFPDIDLLSIVETPGLSPPRACHPVVVHTALAYAAAATGISAEQQLALIDLATRFDGKPGVPGLRFAVELLHDPTAFRKLPDPIRRSALSEIGVTEDLLDSRRRFGPESRELVIGQIYARAYAQLLESSWGPAVRELHAAQEAGEVNQSDVAT
jgi:hypothetical protein